MSATGNSKHVFPGSNTPLGFYSYYDNIITQEKANKIFIIKGGPGTGKSSFMKKVGNYFIDKGIDVEFHHCSSDPLSLDGIVIVPASIAIMDGTSPHTMDPKNPGAIDEIINFGSFWNGEELRKNKDSIMQTNGVIKKSFAKSYYYLGGAKQIYDAYAYTQRNICDEQAMFRIHQDIMQSIFQNHTRGDQTGNARHLFGSAITPDGFVDYLHTIIGKTKNVYIIKDCPGASAEQIMNKIMDQSLQYGLYIECYHSPLSPQKIEDIIIPELDIAVTVANDYHKAKVFPTHVFDLTSCLSSSKLREIQTGLERDKKLLNEIFDRAFVTLQMAKKHHDILESYYIPHVRFEEINHLVQSVIEQIESFI